MNGSKQIAGKYSKRKEKTANKVNCRNINKKTKDNIKIKSFIENIIKNIFMANDHMVRFDNGAFFDYNNAAHLGNSGTKIWSGFSTAVTITESGLYLRLNDKNKLIRRTLLANFFIFTSYFS